MNDAEVVYWVSYNDPFGLICASRGWLALTLGETMTVSWGDDRYSVTKIQEAKDED